jgi:hypothetical protein
MQMGTERLRVLVLTDLMKIVSLKDYRNLRVNREDS